MKQTFGHASQPSEQALVESARQSDAAAMRLIYERHAAHLMAVCVRYLRNDDDAADVVQDTFVKAFTSLDGFHYDGAGSLRAWLTRIAVNESLQTLRRRERLSFVEHPAELPDVAAYDEPDMDGVEPADLLQAVRRLPSGYRAVFVLRVFQQKSHREIAAMLGISENTSASQFHRARALLAQRINQLHNDKR